MKKNFLFLTVLLVLQNITVAQFDKVSLRVDGLTCSACSYSTQSSILKLDFVDNVKMDLNSHIAIITFKPDKKISIDKIATKVYDAGFSVGTLSAEFNFKSTTLTDGNCFEYNGDLYHFEQIPENTKLDGIKTITFISSKYMTVKEFKKWKKNIKKDACKKPDNFLGKVYNIILA